MTPDEEQHLADKIKALLEERTELDFKRGSGITLEKSHYIGGRQTEIEAELSKLKTKPEKAE